MIKFLCFGSLNIDYTYAVPHFVRAGETISASEVKTFCGGKGLNQSIAIARAGGEVYHAGRIGKDGVFLLDEMRRSGVNVDLVTVTEGEQTGHAIIQNTPDGENCILIYRGANGQISESQTDAVMGNFGEGDILVLQNEINDIPHIIAAGKKRGMTIAFTPAPMTEEVKSYPLEDVDYILLNETEALALAGIDGGRKKEDIAAVLANKYPSVRFVLTLGGAGSMYIYREERVRQEADKVKAVDTTAAGDTFAGFFLQSIAEGKSVKQSLIIASKAAAISVTRKGASPSIPYKEELSDG